MTSKESYVQQNRSDLAVLGLRAEEMSEFTSLDRWLSARPARDDTFGPEQKEYKAKGGLRALELMGVADDGQI